jgi:hypothetical protein
VNAICCVERRGKIMSETNQGQPIQDPAITSELQRTVETLSQDPEKLMNWMSQRSDQPQDYLRVSLGRRIVYGKLVRGEVRRELDGDRARLLVAALQKPAQPQARERGYNPKRVPGIEIKAGKTVLFRQERDGQVTVNQIQLIQEASRQTERDQPKASIDPEQVTSPQVVKQAAPSKAPTQESSTAPAPRPKPKKRTKRQFQKLNHRETAVNSAALERGPHPSQAVREEKLEPETQVEAPVPQPVAEQPVEQEVEQPTEPASQASPVESSEPTVSQDSLTAAQFEELVTTEQSQVPSWAKALAQKESAGLVIDPDGDRHLVEPTPPPIPDMSAALRPDDELRSSPLEPSPEPPTPPQLSTVPTAGELTGNEPPPELPAVDPPPQLPASDGEALEFSVAENAEPELETASAANDPPNPSVDIEIEPEETTEIVEAEQSSEPPLDPELEAESGLEAEDLAQEEQNLPESPIPAALPELAIQENRPESEFAIQLGDGMDPPRSPEIDLNLEAPGDLVAQSGPAPTIPEPEAAAASELGEISPDPDLQSPAAAWQVQEMVSTADFWLNPLGSSPDVSFHAVELAEYRIEREGDRLRVSKDHQPLLEARGEGAIASRATVGDWQRFQDLRGFSLGEEAPGANPNRLPQLDGNPETILQALRQQVAGLANGPVKAWLAQTVQDLSVAARQSVAQVAQHLDEQAQQTGNAILQWWTSDEVKAIRTEVDQALEAGLTKAQQWLVSRPAALKNDRVARSVESLFARGYARTQEKAYQIGNYRIELQGTNQYTLKDMQSQATVMRFRSEAPIPGSPWKQMQILSDNPPNNNGRPSWQDLKALVQLQVSGIQPQGSPAAEQQYQQRAIAVGYMANHLLKGLGQTEHDGNLYKLARGEDGTVQVEAKTDQRRLVWDPQRGGVQSNLSAVDLQRLNRMARHMAAVITAPTHQRPTEELAQ